MNENKSSYMESFISDLNNLNKFADSTLNGNKDGMIDAFNNFSWNDKEILDYLPKYCNTLESDRIYIDKVFNHLCPNLHKIYSPSFNTMALWFKTRLYMQHTNAPFQWNDNK